MTMLRVMKVRASGEGRGPGARGASPSSARWTSTTAAVNHASPRQGGRGKPGSTDRAGEGIADGVDAGPEVHLGTLPPVHSV